MVSCSSSALRWLSRPSPGTWLGEGARPLRAGAARFCASMPHTSQPWICSWFRPSALTCSMFWSLSGWLGASHRTRRQNGLRSKLHGALAALFVNCIANISAKATACVDCQSPFRTCTNHGIATSARILPSGHPGPRPTWPPCGLTHASFGVPERNRT